MDGTNYFPRSPRSSLAEDRAALRMAAIMTLVFTLLLVAGVLALAWLFPATSPEGAEILFGSALIG